MDRRKYLKTLAVGTLSTSVLVNACAPEKKPTPTPGATSSDGGPDRQPAEIERFKKLTAEKFFSDHELTTITVLADIIIPRDDVSGSATDAGVPAFIEFIVKDMPDHQVPMRGGLKWLDLQCLKRYDHAFTECTATQQIAMVDDIAWPDKAAPGMQPGVSFFNLMRDLTATGFYTSKIGIQDIGYVGNTPTQWDGVPADVLKQYGLAYDARTLETAVKFS
jgi:gluconate 2-dehydrogenase gamma chain